MHSQFVVLPFFSYWLQLNWMTSIHFKCNKVDFFPLHSLRSIFNFDSNSNQCTVFFLFILSSKTHKNGGKKSNIKTSGVTHAKWITKKKNRFSHATLPSWSVFIENETKKKTKHKCYNSTVHPFGFKVKVLYLLKDTPIFFISF